MIQAAPGRRVVNGPGPWLRSGLRIRKFATVLTTMINPRTLALVGVFGSLSACGGGGNGLPMASANDPAWQSVATPVADAGYRIGALDKLDVTVFQVEDLSFEDIQVDASGNLQMPLIGQVRAEGRTPAELAEDLTRQLGSRFLRNPQVTVSVTEAASQKVTVDGAVTEPGVFEMRGNTSLLQAIAMAKGPTRLADLDRVAVFRVVDGQRMAAVFDLSEIRAGRAEDPRILGDDIVVVSGSMRAAIYRDLLTIAPALVGIFRPY